MAKKSKKTDKKKKGGKREQHPTLFVWEGGIRHYEQGSMLELHTQITTEEWEIIVEQTVAYKVFLECLKQVACPILGEPWDDDDEWFLLQLDVAISRMRNIDTLLVATHDQKAIAKAYTDKMEKNAAEVQELVTKVRSDKREMLSQQLDSLPNIDDGDTTKVSNL
jgi:hypothetical protein